MNFPCFLRLLGFSLFSWYAVP
uniref:Uncharacterized protein n=1 Tax=Arundo donax TaxID=35708 RepID=A0A0A9HBD4_ARUDO